MPALGYMDPLAPGKQVGKYQVVGRLATGGMAEIYLAKATGIQGFEKYVVMKRILPQYAAEERFVRLFLNEARLAATLDHPNIASVYDIDQADGTFFFTMEYLHGEDARFIFKELTARGLPFPIEHALTMVIGVAAGLHAAHEKKDSDGKPLRIVHRDVSLSNVVVTFDGGIKLVDFGIAKAASQIELTGTGQLKGKLAYMSPEQCRAKPIDRRSDVFALGIVLYELTTHTRLFKMDTDVETMRMVSDAVVPLPSLRVKRYPPKLEDIVMKALARDPDQRFATARDLQIALEAFVGEHGIVTSTALLGEWMDHTFGPKLEPWRKMRAEAVATGDGATALGTAVDRRQSPERTSEEFGPSESAALPTLLSPVSPAEVKEHSETAPMTPVAPEIPPRRTTVLWGAVIGLCAIIVVLALRGRAPALDPQPAPGAAPVLVMREKGEVAMEPVGGAAAPTPPRPPKLEPLPGPSTTAGVPAPTSTSTSTGQTAPAAPATPSPASAIRPHPAKTRSHPHAARDPEPSSRSFSATFSRRQGDLSRCFALFPDDAGQAVKLDIHFRADKDGRVTAAEVRPAEVARTKLGDCVVKVASTTTFGTQQGPVAFSIPVMVTRVGSGGRR